jgi:mRNA interferase RelE/StbE
VPAYRIVVLPTAARELAKLPRAMARRIAMAIDGLASDPRPAGVRKLAGGTGDQWRIRVGDYRVLYEIRDAELVVTVVKLAHRRQIYRRR